MRINGSRKSRIGTPTFSVLFLGVLFAGVLAGQKGSRPTRIKQIPLIAVAVTPYGFQPNQVSVTNGEFYVTFLNQTGMQIAITPKEDGDNWLKSTVPAKQLDHIVWRGFQHFQGFPKPGVYRFTEANHPDWILSLSVEENSK